MAASQKGLTWKGYEGADYEQFWTGPGKQSLDQLERAIVDHTVRGGESIAEMGAGFGRLGDCYVKKYRTSHMIEPASNLRAIAARTYGDSVSYHDASVYDLPFADASFDTVLMVRVFHHLGEPEKALKEIHRTLKPGGELVFNYANKRNPKRIAMYFLGKGSEPFTKEMESYFDTLIGHHPAHVDTLLSSAGFAIKEQYGLGITDKIVNAFPSLLNVLKPSVTLARLIGPLRMAPLQFVVAKKL